ncbi:MAG: TraB/GumN family protein [Saprospiraceae bacterium]|nr:TraB/GumN family protein [Saprospiraceae bacterium]
MIKLRALLLFLFLIITGIQYTDAQVIVIPDDPIDSVTYQPLPKSLLWKISGNGIKSPSFLFGTMHIIPKKDYVWTAAAQKAFDVAKQVAFEIDMNEMKDMSLMMSLLQKSFLPDSITLKSLMTEQEYKKLELYFEKIGLPLAMFERMKPVYLSTIILEGQGALTQESTDDVTSSYEMDLLLKANDAHKKVLGLETIDFQLTLLDSIPYKEQAKMLLESIDQESNHDKFSMDGLIKLYVAQDIEALHEAVKSTDSSMSNFEKPLLIDRNKKWISTIESIIAESPTFIAVGAGHLGGNEGVIQLLKQKGYQLTPLY